MKNIFLIAILILAAFLFSFHTGDTLLFDVDEPRYADSAREMIEANDYITPQFNYKPRYDKPILFYWLEIAAFKTFGISEFAARLPSVLAGLGMLTLAFLLGEIQGFGLLSSIIMATMLEVFLLAKFAITDMTLCFFISAAIVFFYLGYHKRSVNKQRFAFKKRNSSRWFTSSMLMMGFAVLTKGPIGLLMPALVIVPFLWWQKDIKLFAKDAKNDLIAGSIGFLLISLPWYLAVHYATAGAFTESFFFKHNFQRFTDVVSHHSGPFWYYIPTVLIGIFPWTFFFAQAFFNPKVYSEPYKPNDSKIAQLLPAFCFWWALILFAFLSVASTKLITYILPIYLPLTIIIAKWWSVKFKAERKKGVYNFDALIGLVLLLVFSIALLYVGSTKFDLIFKNAEAPDTIIPIIIASVMIGTCACVAMTAINNRPRVSFVFTVLPIFATYLIATQYVYVPFNSYMQKGIKTFVTELVPQEAKLIIFGSFKPSSVFYRRKRVVSISKGYPDIFINKMNSVKPRYFIAKPKYLDRLTEKIKSREDLKEPLYYIWHRDHRYAYGANIPKTPQPETKSSSTETQTHYAKQKK